MEGLGDLCNGEWESLSALFSSLQELDQSLIPMANFNDQELQLLPNNGGSEIHNCSSWFYSLDAFDPNFDTSTSCTTDHSSGSDLFMPIDETNFGSSFFSDVLMEEVLDQPLVAHDCHCQPPLPPPQLVDSAVALKRKVVNKGEFSDGPKRKTRVSGGDGQKKKNKKRKGNQNVEEEGNNNGSGASDQGQSSISYSSEEDNGLLEGHGGSAATSDGGLNAKARASRGSATDPQSLYARKRREKINERLKILQKLVPNGTKVDISTMLEEAVHYVKFLQIQIKLLSSDDMWMFAPLAYNGMDLGLHQNFSPFLSH